MYFSLSLIRSSVSSRQSTPRKSLQSKTLDIGVTALTMSSGTTPRDSSPQSSVSSIGSKGSEGRRVRSKPPSPMSPSSRDSSRPPSSLDLTIRPT